MVLCLNRCLELFLDWYSTIPALNVCSVVLPFHMHFTSKTVFIFFALLAGFACYGFAAQNRSTSGNLERHINQQSLPELEQRKAEIINELSQLAEYSMRSGVGSIGYRSLPYESPHHTEWFQVDLEESTPIDEIILVPAIWRDAQVGFISDGFPLEFKIIAGQSGEEEGTVVATFEESDSILPRIAPLIIPVDSIEASWIRLEATLLSRRAFDNRYVLQMSGLMIFNGHDNVAIRGSVTASSEQKAGSGAWSKNNLIRGFLPYLMDTAEGRFSRAYVSENGRGNMPVITIDLEDSYLVDSIFLHGVEQGDTVPQAYPGDFGVPRWLQIMGSTNPDFSDAEILYDFKVRSSLMTAPIMMLPLEPKPVRYVRFVVKEDYESERYDGDGNPIINNRNGFAEIEILSKGKNLSRGKQPATNFPADSPNRSISALTDGLNLYGAIIPVKDWMRQLAKRHDLELERPLIEAELEQRYERQAVMLRILSWVIAALIAGTVFYILITRHLKERAIFRLRNRIAADLHDELGANLYAVSMLGELAAKAKEDPEKVHGLIERIRSLTQRTSKAVKYCTNILETPGLYADFEDAMIRNADRLLADLDHKLVFEAEDTITKMRAGKRIDLFLFYKECLINIIRHSGATEAETRLKTEGKKLHLQVSDNGRGFPDSTDTHVPLSLKRRAKLLGGKVSIATPQTGGAQIHLFMPI